jgi:rod shape-determining protein MreC
MEHQPPPFFKTGPAPLVRLTFFVLLSVLLLVLDAHFHYLEVLRLGVTTVLRPVQSVAGAPAWLIGRVGEFFVTQSALQNENADLTQKELLDAKTLMQMDALAAENTHLRELLGARKRLPVNALLAEILYSARDPFSRKVIVNKGQQDGIKPGEIAVDNVGVIGQVTRVYPFMSEVTLITDKEQTVPVQVVRNGLRALAYGGGDGGSLDLRFMPDNADIKSGDELVTSGIDGVYLPGLPVATVVTVERNAAFAFARISCVPKAGIDRHAQILILLSEREQEPPPAAEESRDKPAKPKRGHPAPPNSPSPNPPGK